jgi:hypothetical protein
MSEENETIPDLALIAAQMERGARHSKLEKYAAMAPPKPDWFSLMEEDYPPHLRRDGVRKGGELRERNLHDLKRRTYEMTTWAVTWAMNLSEHVAKVNSALDAKERCSGDCSDCGGGVAH